MIECLTLQAQEESLKFKLMNISSAILEGS